MLPPEPAPWRPESPAEHPWHWRGEDASGAEVSADLLTQGFVSQAEAESWLGGCFAELVELGVDRVVLLEADREVYGPMSLHA